MPSTKHSHANHLDKIEHHGHKQRGKQIYRLAILDAENAKSGTNDQHTSHYAQFYSHRLWHTIAKEIPYGIEHPLPTKQDWCRP